LLYSIQAFQYCVVLPSSMGSHSSQEQCENTFEVKDTWRPRRNNVSSLGSVSLLGTRKLVGFQGVSSSFKEWKLPLVGDMNFIGNGFFPMVKTRWDSLHRHWWWGRYKDMEVAKKWEVWTSEKKAREGGKVPCFVGDDKGGNKFGLQGVI